MERERERGLRGSMGEVMSNVRYYYVPLWKLMHFVAAWSRIEETLMGPVARTVDRVSSSALPVTSSSCAGCGLLSYPH